MSALYSLPVTERLRQQVRAVQKSIVEHIVAIRAKDLVLGASYQRQVDSEHAKHIAETFDVRKALVIIVSKRENGELFVVDGQHRVIAALQHDANILLPCIVYEGLSEAEEAALFAELTRERRAMSAHDVFWADLIAGSTDAVGVHRIVNSTGYHLHRTEGMSTALYCYSALRSAYNSDDGDSLQSILTTTMRAWGPGEPPTAQIVKAIHAFVIQYKGEYDPDRLVHVLSRHTKRQFDAKLKEAHQYFGEYSGSTHGGRAIREFYNRGLRSKRLREWVAGKSLRSKGRDRNGI